LDEKRNNNGISFSINGKLKMIGDGNGECLRYLNLIQYNLKVFVGSLIRV
jgi:hypothetical protein